MHEVKSLTKVKRLHHSYSEVDPALCSTFIASTGVNTTNSVSSQRNLPVGVEDFFRSALVEQRVENSNNFRGSLTGNLNLLSSGHLIISPIIPKEKFVRFYVSRFPIFLLRAWFPLVGERVFYRVKRTAVLGVAFM